MKHDNIEINIIEYDNKIGISQPADCWGTITEKYPKYFYPIRINNKKLF
jgi:hypothetical protein